jgi:hypothetical protein
VTAPPVEGCQAIVELSAAMFVIVGLPRAVSVCGHQWVV